MQKCYLISVTRTGIAYLGACENYQGNAALTMYLPFETVLVGNSGVSLRPGGNHRSPRGHRISAYRGDCEDVDSVDLSPPPSSKGQLPFGLALLTSAGTGYSLVHNTVHQRLRLCILYAACIRKTTAVCVWVSLSYSTIPVSIHFEARDSELLNLPRLAVVFASC